MWNFGTQTSFFFFGGQPWGVESDFRSQETGHELKFLPAFKEGQEESMVVLNVGRQIFNFRRQQASKSSFLVSTVDFFPLRAKLLFVVVLFLSVAPLSPVVPDATGVELFFVARTASGSAPSARFCAALPPSPTLYCHTSPGGAPGTRAR